MKKGLTQICLSRNSLIRDGLQMCREIGYQGFEILLTDVSLPGMSGNFHRYGLAWDTSHCTFYTDGKKGSTYWYPAGSPFGRGG